MSIISFYFIINHIPVDFEMGASKMEGALKIPASRGIYECEILTEADFSRLSRPFTIHLSPAC
jgi:hypothetical protein